MSMQSDQRAVNFIENETQFHLGFLPTEQSHPLTVTMEKDFQRSTADGVRTLQRPDRLVLEMAKKMLRSAHFAQMVEAGEQTLSERGRIIFSGCGATGRLSILLEAMFRQYAKENPALDGDGAESIMTGGDFALIRSVEFFEDYQSFGREQVRMTDMGPHDMLVAITEGGETSSVIGTVKEAAERNCRVFLLFNNPAELLREHLTRCREVIDDARVTVLDLSCGPMALAGSTRMQATTSEELIAGAFLETVIARRFGLKEIDWAAEFAKLLDHLAGDGVVRQIADAIDFEDRVYRERGRVTYYAKSYLLDLFTDTTERSPTFMLPPFKLASHPDDPESWAFVKNPTADAPAVWREMLGREPRCLAWNAEDYCRMNAPREVFTHLPQIGIENLFGIPIGNEKVPARYDREADVSVLVMLDRAPDNAALLADAPECQHKIVISSGCEDSPLHLMDHLAVKLFLNTLSTGTMVKNGRVSGNWMSWVAVSNKKLIDRAIRLIVEIAGISYEESCRRLFAAMEELEKTQKQSDEKASVVQYVLKQLKRSFEKALIWKRAQTPAELHDLLSTLGEEFPIREGENANLFFTRCDDRSVLAVRKKENKFHITYGDAGFAGRGIAYALAGIEHSEKIFFTTHATLLDCSRTGVVTVDYFKRYLRRIALLGFNVAMLYTKDAYVLPGEPYFGYMRGAYTREEIREIDAYARKLNIEMIASIQALGHLEPVLRWNIYKPIKDTDNVLLTTSEASYQLLEKMIGFWSDALGSRRIHLGMDETHDLGRGKFMDQNGYKRGFDIYNEHLQKVVKICRKFQLKPIIWNDMYFKFASSDGTYYNLDTEVPADVCADIPREVQTSYWDYYHLDKETYLVMLQKSQKLNGNPPFMATGIWTWGELWCDYGVTDLTTRPCIDACRELGVKEIVYTMWGDDGGYCEFDSAFAGMARVADYAFNDVFSETRTKAIFEAVCHADYDTQIALGDIQMPVEDKTAPDKICAPALLWDDPLMNIHWRDCWKLDWTRVLNGYRKLRDLAAVHWQDQNAGMVQHAFAILDVLIRKIELRQKLMQSYADRDFPALKTLCDKDIPEIIDAICRLNETFRVQWFRKYKSFGLEVMQIRLAGLRERYRELGRRIQDLLGGKCDRIDELDIPIETVYQPEHRYRMLATGGWFI